MKRSTDAKANRSDSAKPQSPGLESPVVTAPDRRPREQRVAPDDALHIDYPEDLPITDHRDRLIELMQDHQVLIVCGETGSGKSTQLPKLCWEAGFGRTRLIGHTQPRRLAARSIATRLAEETKTILGNEIGYQVRFGDQTNDRTVIKLMTDGILLAETRSDRELNAYDVIIIDEAHERSLNIDFLLGYLKRLLAKRPGLRLIITSATIDADRFAEHFGVSSGEGDEIIPAPIVMVEGRGYPVEIRYLPWEDIESSATRGYDLAQHVTSAIDSLRRDGTGDTLVFLPTERDIREVSHDVSGHFKRSGLEGRVELLPLYARLPQSQQQAIFKPTGNKQRIIFATNVAESSLTVPGIRYVIDSGTARISRYSVRSKVQRLPIEAVSRASANQRSGRCGRIGPGICVRLYDLDDFESRDAFTTPEIRRTNLASVVLQSKTLRLGDLAKFPLLDPPRPEAIAEGHRTLVELGAIDDEKSLTDIGWQMGRMPVDPRVARILIGAHEHDVLSEVLPIAAALEIPDPRDRPPNKREAADKAHEAFADPESDFIALLRLWRFYDNARSQHSRNRLTKVLRQNFLSPNRMREWSDVYRQLRQMVGSSFNQRGGKKGARGKTKVHVGPIRYCDDSAKQSKERARKGDADAPAPIVDQDRYANIHQALLTGLLSGVAMAGDKKEYTGAGGLKLYLWPGSGVFAAKPKWIVAGELVETSKAFARTVARIQPGWIEATAEHLLKSSFSDPHWSRKSGGSFCYQRRSLYGLPVVLRRRVPLAPIDSREAWSLLIRHGLIDGELPTTANFVKHNRRLLVSIEQLAAKTRRRDLVVDDYTLLAFYQTRIPELACDRPRLEKWDRQVETPDWTRQLGDEVQLAAWLASPPKIDDQSDTNVGSEDADLSPYLRPEDLLDVSTDGIDQDDFPDELASGSSRLPLEYHFRPGTDEDGIHLTIHSAALPQVSDDALEWLVPGQLEPKVIAMIKSLPKRLRRLLVPAADVARQVTQSIADRRDGSAFMPTLCGALTQIAETRIGPEDFQSDKLEPHLRFLIRVVNDEGEVVATDRSVDSIKQTLQVELVQDASVASPGVEENQEDWHRDSMTRFDIESLPREVVRRRGGVQVAQYPGLVDEGQHVRTMLFSDAVNARSATQLGLTRLFAIACRKDLRAQVRHLPSLHDAKLKLGPIVSSAVMESSLADLLARLALVEKQPLVYSQAEFEERLAVAPAQIAGATQEVAVWLSKWVTAYHAMRCLWEDFPKGKFRDASQDIDRQLKWLLTEGFISWTPWQNLQHLPRYLDGIAYRLDKIQTGAASRDAESLQTVSSLWQRWQASLPEHEAEPRAVALSEFRWMIEELRVSQFAQPLGTAVKVSPQRCEKLLAR